MNSKTRTWVLSVFSIACVLSTAGLISVGHSLFDGRPRLFWLFFAYAAVLGGIVLFFGFRIINLKFPRPNKPS